ncbi:MAG: CoA-binding protein [Actinomycetota bacterium]|nr:CoA-binding protein [Actinomycetota bacterium]MDD5667228.1 CoA-binding protein [Actinomycetota bacterium]
MHPLQQIMYPSSIAVFGASNNPMKMGSIQLANILETGYEGEVYPIHRSEETVMGVPAYKSIAEVDKPVDLAQLVLPTEVVPQILEECGKAGVRRAIIISGGFKEVPGEVGRERERQLLEVAAKYGIRFLGPNCVGIMNGRISLNTTTIVDPPMGGGIAFASQSGAYTAMINPYLRAQGIRMCQTLSVGNEADMDLVDCLDYLREEDYIKAVGLYVEAIRRPREFIAAARETVKRKPVVAIYVGGTAAGSRSSLSHTGAISGPDELYDGLFRQAGILRADDLDQMLDMLWILSMQPLPAGRRMAVITNSGGPGSSLAYHLEKAGLEAPPFSAGLRERLDAVTGPLTFTGNPIDLTFETNVFIFKQLLELVYESGEVDGAFIYGIFGASDFMVNLKKRFPAMQAMEEEWGKGYQEFLAGLAEVPRQHARPLAVMSLAGARSRSIQSLIDFGVPSYPSASRSARAMRALLDYRLTREALT